MSETIEKKAITDSSIARMAGNIAAGLVDSSPMTDEHLRWIAERSVKLARLIADELEAEAR